MPLAPKAIRVKTAAGWQDIALQGPPGPVASVPIEPWREVGAAGQPAFQNSWVNYGAPHETLAFRKMPDGMVQLKGTIKSGASPTAGSICVTLPVGYRPAKALRMMPTVNTVGGGAAAWGLLWVDPTGTVAVYANDNVAASMDGIAFPTDQTTFPAGAPIITPVATLPTSPTDGQEAYLQTTEMAAQGIIWRFRWRAAASRWDYLGGGDFTFSMEGANNAYQAAANGTLLTTNAAASIALQWNYTPPVAVWVEVEWWAGVMQKTDAAYHYAMLEAVASPAPPSGFAGPQVYTTQHASVQQFEHYSIRKRWGLAASTAYSMYARWLVSGGTWQYSQGASVLWMTGRAWPR